ncbi:MAG TPA: hypothetical protein VHD15_15725 [Hyphomicrobiales bacterium]|nr:hypothetical protein [Hyphomicrobiales bacterium]
MTNLDNDVSANNGIKLLLAWLLVGIPLVWGVVETAINAAKLFQ